MFRISHLRWWICALLVGAAVLNYVDRQTLSALAPTIQADLKMDDRAYADVVNIFLVAYTIAYLVSGRIADLMGTRASMVLFVAWWSVANMLTAAAQGVQSLGIYRFLLGLGEEMQNVIQSHIGLLTTEFNQSRDGGKFFLFIADEVITGFGRTGSWTGAEAFGVTPDILNVAKQVTNGVQPLGAVIARQEIYDTFMAAGGPGYMLEFPHGYTYSAHPVPCAAGLASLDLLERDHTLQRVRDLAPHFEAAVHGLRGARLCWTSATSAWPPASRSTRCPASQPNVPTRSPWRCCARASTCATAATPSSWRRPSSAPRRRSTGCSTRWARASTPAPEAKPWPGAVVGRLIQNSQMPTASSAAGQKLTCSPCAVC